MRSSRVVRSQVCAIPAGGDRGWASVAIKNAAKVAQDRRAKAGILVGWLGTITTVPRIVSSTRFHKMRKLDDHIINAGT